MLVVEQLIISGDLYRLFIYRFYAQANKSDKCEC